MAKWLAPAIGALALVVAVAVGVVVWAQPGGGGSCDRTLLAVALGDGIRVADQIEMHSPTASPALPFAWIGARPSRSRRRRGRTTR